MNINDLKPETYDLVVTTAAKVAEKLEEFIKAHQDIAKIASEMNNSELITEFSLTLTMIVLNDLSEK